MNTRKLTKSERLQVLVYIGAQIDLIKAMTGGQHIQEKVVRDMLVTLVEMVEGLNDVLLDVLRGEK